MRRPIRVLVGLVLVLGLVVGVAGGVLLVTRYRVFAVDGDSMQPTLRTGERLVVRKGTTPQRGEIVVLAPKAWTGPLARDADTVKRVLAVGGDSVVCCTNAQVASLGSTPGTAGSRVIRIPAGRLFMVGDNTEVSIDSRSHLETAGGTVAVGSVVGRVEAVVSLSGWHSIGSGGNPLGLAVFAVGGLLLAGGAAVTGSIMDQRNPRERVRQGV